jgi:plastocyanin
LVYSAAALVAAVTGRTANAATSHHEVKIKSFAFEPQEITVRVGDTVSWTNLDIAPHTATGLDHVWDTGELGRQVSRTLTVTSEMAGEYYCVFHPHMKAIMTVLDT